MHLRRRQGSRARVLAGALIAAVTLPGMAAVESVAKSPRSALAARALCIEQGGEWDADVPGAYGCVNGGGTQFSSEQLERAAKICTKRLGGTFETFASRTTESGVTGPGYGCLWAFDPQP